MQRVLCVIALALASAFVATNGAAASPCNRVYTPTIPGAPIPVLPDPTRLIVPLDRPSLVLVEYVRCERARVLRTPRTWDVS